MNDYSTRTTQTQAETILKQTADLYHQALFHRSEDEKLYSFVCDNVLLLKDKYKVKPSAIKRALGLEYAQTVEHMIKKAKEKGGEVHGQ